MENAVVIMFCFSFILVLTINMQPMFIYASVSYPELGAYVTVYVFAVVKNAAYKTRGSIDF